MPVAQQGFVITDSGQIVDGIVKRADLEADAIDGTKIEDDAVDSEHLAAAGIDNEHLADNAVGDDEIAAHTTSKITVPVGQLNVASEAQGDILIRGASAWTRLAAGNSGEFLKTLGAGANPAWAAAGGFSEVATGTFSHDISSTTTVNEAHGLSAAPDLVLVFAISSGSSQSLVAMGCFAGATQNSIFNEGFSSFEGGEDTSNGIKVRTNEVGDVSIRGAISVDATNVTFTWTKNGSPTGTAYFLWVAIG